MTKFAQWAGAAAALVAAMTLGACSPYVANYEFMPRPVYAAVPPPAPNQPPPLVALASVIGIRRTDKDAGIPASVEVRLRLDNDGPQGVSFNPQTLELNNGALVKFPPALVHPPQPITVAPMQSAMVEAWFPFPAGHSWDDTELGSLQLSWMVRIGEQDIKQVVYFQRVTWAYYDPYWGHEPYPWASRVVIMQRR